MEKSVGLYHAISVEMIVAHSCDQVIGVGGKIPWARIPEDFAYFRAQTMGLPCIMGRNTYDSLPIPGSGDGSPLPGRDLIVLSRRRREVVKPRTYNVRRIPSALGVAANLLEKRDSLLPEGKQLPRRIMVIGGEKIYARLFIHVDRIHITTVHTTVFPRGSPPAEVSVARFPELDLSEWESTNVMVIGARQTPDKGVIPGFRIDVYQRPK